MAIVQQLPLTGFGIPAIAHALLPVFEVDKSRARESGWRIAGQSRGHTGIRSCLGKASRFITVRRWDHFHAAAKTELSRSFSLAEAARRAVCFWALYDDLFEWNAQFFCLRNGAVESRKDAARTNAASRFGESCALRLMHELGYIFWDHLPTLWRRAQGPITHPEQVHLPQILTTDPSLRPSEQPDFIVEDPGNRVALMEAKGNFVSPGASYRSPSTPIKHTLARAIDQLAAWPTHIAPPPASSFAVATVLREHGDSRDPSLIAFADPDGERDPPGRPSELPPDFIRRGNYGAWLLGMGFDQTGNALRNRLNPNAGEVRLAVVTIGGDDFALRLNPFLCPCYFPSAISPEEVWSPSPLLTVDWQNAMHWFKLVRRDVPVIGLERRILHNVARAANDATSDALLGVDGLSEQKGGIDRQDQVEGETAAFDGFTGSILRDGSLVGTIPPQSSLWETLRYDTFRL